MISVVIPLYNKEQSIQNTIISVLTQSFNEFELIIVNDGSTDDSCNIVKQINDSRIILINQENKGVSHARNRGIKEARFDYIALIDADDQWEPVYLENMISLIKKFPKASLYGSTWSFLLSDKRIITSEYGIEKDFCGYVKDYFQIGIKNSLFHTSAVVFEKKAFLDLGMFNEDLSIGEDVDLWIRFALKTNLAFINKPLTYYSLAAKNRITTKSKPRNKCLIWNLEMYKEYELKNPDFKRYLDSWRFAHIINYFKGDTTEIQEITSLLNDIDLSRYPVFWTVMKYLPANLQILFYDMRLKYQRIFRGKATVTSSELDLQALNLPK